MKILLIGGTGAIGSALKTILSEYGDNEIYITSRRPHISEKHIHYIQGDAHNSNFLTGILDSKWDAVVDFMIYSTKEFEDRVSAFLNFSNQYIFTSSGRVYAKTDNLITEDSFRLLDVCENAEYLRSDEYALSKAREENILFCQKRKNWTIIRPYITYNTDRLQLGYIEKDLWLWRGIHGLSIPFPQDIAERQTTMTWGVMWLQRLLH